MKIVVTGDLHLDSAKIGIINPQTNIDLRIEDFFNNFDFIINKAIEEKVSIFVLNGDILKGRETTHAIESLISERFKKITDNMNLIIVLGNHDYTSKGLSYNLNAYSVFEKLRLNNLIIVKEIEIYKKDDFEILLYPYYDCKSRHNFKDNNQIYKMIEEEKEKIVCDKRIFIGHGTPEGTIFFENTSTDTLKIEEPVIPKTILKDFDICLFSHIHKNQFIKDNIYHIGSIERVDFGEAESKKYFAIYDTDTPTKVKMEELPCRAMYDIKLDYSTIDKDNVTEDIFEKLNEINNFKEAMVKVSIKCREDQRNLLDIILLKQKLSTAFYSLPIKFDVINRKDKLTLRCEDLQKELTDDQILKEVLKIHKSLSEEDRKKIELLGKAIIIQATGKV